MDPQKISFSHEISLMMFGFGDSHTPNPKTVDLVENIVHDQLRTILKEALRYSPDGVTIRGEELVFLMRHNKYKMRRFVKYLNNKALKRLAHSAHSCFIDFNSSDIRKTPLIQFIEKIDETGEFTDLEEFDQVKQDRLLRADRISQALDEVKYMEFCKARAASFTSKATSHRDLEKFRRWINPASEFKLKGEALDVLAYMAYETVAEITDYALLVRMDVRSSSDPLSQLAGSYYNATMFNGDYRFSSHSYNMNYYNLDYSRVYSGQPPISENEIKEVMRRVYSPQAGLMNFGSDLPETHFMFAL